MRKTKLSGRTLGAARAMCESMMEAACSIFSSSKSDDGYGDVGVFGLREVSTCNIRVLGSDLITDEMRQKDVSWFHIETPASSALAVGERMTTTWTPVEGDPAVSITLEVTEVNVPRTDAQLAVEAIGYLVK